MSNDQAETAGIFKYYRFAPSFVRIAPMPSLSLKPTHKAVTAYYDSLAKFAKLGIKYETAVRSAFHEMPEICAAAVAWGKPERKMVKPQL